MFMASPPSSHLLFLINNGDGQTAALNISFYVVMGENREERKRAMMNNDDLRGGEMKG
jgi:hypothetical protein